MGAERWGVRGGVRERMSGVSSACGWKPGGPYPGRSRYTGRFLSVDLHHIANNAHLRLVQ